MSRPKNVPTVPIPGAERLDLELEGNVGIGDEIMREFIWLATGRVIPPGQKIQISDFCIPITETLINRLAVLGLATAAFKTRRGSEKSAHYLVDRCLGQSVKPFKEQVNDLNLDDAKAMLLKEFKDGLGINDALASDIVKRLMESDKKDHGL